MRMRRIVAATAVTALATGASLLLSSPTGAAPAPAPTPISFDATGLSSTSCPVNLPLNNKIALATGTAIQFKPGLVSGLGGILGVFENLKVTPIDSTGKATGAGAGPTKLPWAKAVTYKAGEYRLDWSTAALGGAVKTLGTGILEIAAGASGCQLAVQVPGVGVDPSQLPVVGGIVGSILPPVNVPGTTVPVPGLPATGAKTPKTPAGAGGSSTYLNYKPLGNSIADSIVPKGYGSGSGAAGQYVAPGQNGSINAPASSGGGKSVNAAGSAPLKYGGSPKTVDLAVNGDRSALGALPGLLVILAIIALSGATAFYARTFLLRPSKA
jgi:hypothetical protein